MYGGFSTGSGIIYRTANGGASWAVETPNAVVVGPYAGAVSTILPQL